LIAPFHVVFIKNTAPINEFVAGWLLAAALAISCAGYLVSKVWKRDIRSMALLWLVAGFLLVLVACAGHADMGFVIEPHWLYFSSFGFFMLLAACLLALRQKMALRAWVALVVIIGGFYGAMTQAYNAITKTEKSYCLYWLARSPGNIIAALRLGELYYEEKEYDKAERLLSFAAGKYTNKIARSRLLHNLGVIYNETGSTQLARDKFLEAIRVNPDYVASYLALGDLYAKDGRFQEAQQYLIKAIVLKPDNELTFLTLAQLHLAAGKPGRAVAVLEDFLKLNPHHASEDLVREKILSIKAGFKPVQFPAIWSREVN
jgi:tetratricopeptide (TPR) repeat protein